MTRFSIVVPCFNAEATIAQTLESLRAQSVTDLEIICVDDGSTDATRDVITAIAAQDNRIRLVRNAGKGPSDARNHGAMTMARGEILAFCDADDLWGAAKLARLDTVFRAGSVDGAYSRIAFFEKEPDDASTVSTIVGEDLRIGHLLGENPVCTMSNLAVTRAAFLKTGGFDAGIVHNEDLEWLIRLVGGGARVIGIDEVLTFYRRNPGGLSADLAAMAQGREAALKTAAGFGEHPEDRHEAIHFRYLARRALRMGLDRTQAARFALNGMRASPAGFFAPPRRGVLTLGGALAALVLPRRLSLHLFSR
ncbi:glycosyltransferase [Cognatishimia sp. F0-27]|uniref:glycosyltransferase family 2 protein n=1 Tax=Cognatishimia sp. F0-27 TaxID=2816855 RepID=UPI001D0C38D5|nr:glycosyltransferase [Cognatishimia sp. F0-27]MCC1493858.1 glycosyltransferase [Cognatishimia sp. F0-27]